MPWARSSQSRAQALGDVWSGPDEGLCIYLYITRCKLICLARKNTFLLPSKLSCFSPLAVVHWKAGLGEQNFREHAEVLVRQGCHLQGVSSWWAPEPGDPNPSPSSVTIGWATLAGCPTALCLYFLTGKMGMTTCPAQKEPLLCYHQS